MLFRFVCIYEAINRMDFVWNVSRLRRAGRWASSGFLMQNAVASNFRGLRTFACSFGSGRQFSR